MTKQAETIPCRAPGCGRDLRSPESKAAGYGPVCYRRLYPPTPRAAAARTPAAARPGTSDLDELQEPLW